GRLEQFFDLAFAEPSHPRSQMDREEVVCLDLGKEALGSADTHLRTASGVKLGVGLARERRVNRIGNGDQMASAVPALFHRSQRVSGLARLGNRHYQGALVDRRTPIAELVRVID